MNNREKIDKINSIYREFLNELKALKEQADSRTRLHIESIEKEEIDKILDKIKNNHN